MEKFDSMLSPVIFLFELGQLLVQPAGEGGAYLVDFGVGKLDGLRITYLYVIALLVLNGLGIGERNESGCIGAKRQCRVAAFGTDVSHSFRIAVPDRFEIKILT